METNAGITDKLGINNIIEFIFPPICISCNTYNNETDYLVCSPCWERAANRDYPICSSCRHPVGSNGICAKCKDLNYFPVFSLGEYKDPLKAIIHQYKYHGLKRLGETLAEKLMDRFQDNLAKYGSDLIIPVPLRSYREKSRGFNQAAVLADIIGKRLNRPSAPEALIKIRRTADQARLDLKQRLENIKGSFKVSNVNLANKKVIIVDDVITTGATVAEAARVIIEAGAKPVAVCTIAMTDS